MGMKGDDDLARARSVCGESNTAVRSIDFASVSALWDRHARNARASSRESAAMMKGRSLGLPSHVLNVSPWAAMEGVKISGVICGSEPSAQRFQQLSRVS